MRFSSINKNLTFKTKFRHLDRTVLEELYITSDKRRISQVLTELLANSIKFTQEGTISIRIRLEDPNILHFEIKDTGLGIDEAVLERILNPEDFPTLKPANS